MAEIKLSHRELCDIAKSWLRRPNCAGGHGCNMSFSEVRVGYHVGESPDAIGYRVSSYDDGGTVVVEAKVSRADFRADAKKPHRNDGEGMGKWRYYMCPEGIIQPDEVPERWGLLYVTARRKVVAVSGPASFLKHHSNRPEWPAYTDALKASAFNDRDHEGEMLVLASILNRIGDADAMNQRLRVAEGHVKRLARDVEKFREKESRLRERIYELEREREPASIIANAGSLARPRQTRQGASHG